MRPELSDLIGNLVVTTDQFMTGSYTPSSPAERANARGQKPRIDIVRLVWSAAVRANPDIIIQASIRYVALLPSSRLVFIYLILRVGQNRE